MVFPLFFCILETKKTLMHNIKISDSLYKELSGYCKLNSLEINDYAENLLKEALLKEKYGDIPFGVIGDEHINEEKSEK